MEIDSVCYNLSCMSVYVWNLNYYCPYVTDEVAKWKMWLDRSLVFWKIIMCSRLAVSSYRS